MPEQAPSDLESARILSDKIEQARRSGAYMVAIYHLTEERKVQLDRVTHNFPVVDFDGSVDMLKRDLDAEKAGMLPAPPQELQPARDAAAPVINLFGDGPSKNEDPS